MNRLEHLNYDQETGDFRWSESAPRRAGAKAVSLYKPDNYWLIKVDGRLQRAHRIAWLITYGEMPDGEIDHINGDRLDNRIANLRVVNRSENAQNQRKAQSGNRTGLLGVSFHKPSGKWRARICIDGITHYLGYHPSPAAASEAYLRAKKRLHPAAVMREPCHA